MSEYISKEEALKIVGFEESWLSDTNKSAYDVDIAFHGLKKKIESAPSADVRENIHGQWEDDSEGFAHCHCSKCGLIISPFQKWFKCCPQCMAVMDEKPFKNCHKTKCEACIYHGYCDRENMREPKGEKGTE